MSSSQHNANVTPLSPTRHHAATSGSRSWLRHVGLLNDYVRIPYANGSSFATQFLYREFRARGQEVTVVGPDDPQTCAGDMPDRAVCLSSVPLRVHPGVRLPLPTTRGLGLVAAQRFDIVLGQTASALADLGVWLRATQHVPFLCVNTLHLPSAYNVLLPDRLLENPVVHGWFREQLVPWLERHSAEVYNRTDGLVVLSRGLERYWRAHGVEVPIHVIPRAVEPKIFDDANRADPFAERAALGSRLLCVCRHSREKGVARLLTLFAQRIAPVEPAATLTLVGDGPEHDSYRAQAAALGVAERVFFPGEVPLTDIPAYYRHADLFVYPSLSETYGQVVSEALWCGLPVIAFADGMGVSDQIEHGRTGFLIDPRQSEDGEQGDRDFSTAVLRLLRNPRERHALATHASTRARVAVHPARVMDLYYEAFEDARAHCLATVEQRVDTPLASVRALGRWAWVQAAAAGLGCLRSPAIVNRHGRRQPGWNDLHALRGRATSALEPLAAATGLVAVPS
jgi:glycosyltransferase involved in cell wall biosynthesis